MDQTILEVQDLRIHFELREGTVKALNGIDLVLKEGRTLGLVGETGAGKTTLAKGIMGLTAKPYGKIKSGKILYEGKNLLEMDKKQLRRIRGEHIVKHVNTVVTPGEVVDVVVTEQGIAVNPRRPDLKEKIEAAGLHVFTIEQLQQRAEALVGVPEPIRYKDRIVGVVMYRDNTIIDVVHEIDEDA